jgi:histidinol-phosphate aminotransferase
MRNNLQPIHGSTDSGPPPQFDFSSNANALGPNPHILKALQSVDPTHYPDPNYTNLHQALANYHQVNPEQVAVGAGASELIFRLSRYQSPSAQVLTFAHTFGEYQRSAQLAGLSQLQAQTPTAFLAHLNRANLAFLCVPNNPTGELYGDDFLQEVASSATRSRTTVVIDRAYLTLSQVQISIPNSFWQLYAPNKAHGMTGIRAGYLIAPESLLEFRNYAPSWVLSVHGEAFLRAVLTPESQDWVNQCCPMLWAWRDRLRDQLTLLNHPQTWSQANFGLIQVGNATQVTQALRHAGIRVRDCTSFGLPDRIRLSAQPVAAQDALIAALTNLDVRSILDVRS